MIDKNEFENLEQWLELSREDKLKTLFDCPDSWRRKQVQYLWGPNAYGYRDYVRIPMGTAWNEIVKVVFPGNCICSIEFEIKSEYISQIDMQGYYKLLELENKNLGLGDIDTHSANESFWAFNSWRISNLSGGKVYFFDVEKFDENTLLLILCTAQGSYGDKDGFGIEPDRWTSALFDLNGNIVQPFRPGIIPTEDE